MRAQSFLRQRNFCTLILMLGIAGTFGTAFWQIPQIAVAFGVVSGLALVFLIKKNRLFHDATLIRDNQILVVSPSLVYIPSSQMKKDADETIVSTFGILMDSKIYRWGRDGVHGVRLHTAHINQEWLYLTFGDATKTIRVELLHGMTEKQAVLDAAQKLLHETGVTADINGW